MGPIPSKPRRDSSVSCDAVVVVLGAVVVVACAVVVVVSTAGVVVEDVDEEEADGSVLSSPQPARARKTARMGARRRITTLKLPNASVPAFHLQAGTGKERR
jgi:hypothetical protein